MPACRRAGCGRSSAGPRCRRRSQEYTPACRAAAPAPGGGSPACECARRPPARPDRSDCRSRPDRAWPARDRPAPYRWHRARKSAHAAHCSRLSRYAAPHSSSFCRVRRSKGYLLRTRASPCAYTPRRPCPRAVRSAPRRPRSRRRPRRSAPAPRRRAPARPAYTGLAAFGP